MQKKYKYARMIGMITVDEIKNLAHLARIEVTDEEAEMYAKDFESILGYVDQIKRADVSQIDIQPLEVNIARIDENPTVSDTNRDTLLGQAPESQDGFYRVPKIL
jgi:aspartyl-tRNA(Asn)/glutamyl-tRNA(Gln) amidotransferase subunit C